ncbi:TIGR03086 family protein [Lentzea sp. NBRC 105346]|uniref:TIGR03086 family metal-binding protein n=1 Tax=Lentzea sp. NBRC 105346 TaxID=3032205 RepID=UPI0024A3161B|nr:TIGR03086 family metal-binding protein [Lentzea sp. NBRC 105346]GLZ28290.1 TIGR03086 family protein [Lentzea sp. NBRC 105346]
MKISELLDAARKRAEPVLQGVTDDQLDQPTPCAEYTVRDLLNHLLHVVVQFQELAAKRDADFSTTPDRVEEDWRAEFTKQLENLVRAWDAPGAEEGTSGQMSLPARTVGQMALLDLTVHAWDIARATGQDFTPDPAAVDELFGFVDQMGPTAREMNVFGPATETTAGASEFERLLAATGRIPV